MSDQTEAKQPTAKPRGRKRTILLFVSLTLNLALIGFLVVGAIRHAPWERGPDRGRDSFPGPVSLILRDRPATPELDAIRARYRQPMRESLNAFRQSRQALGDLLRKPGPVDPDELAAALNDMEAKGDRLQTVTRDAMMEMLPAMPEDVRARMFRAPPPDEDGPPPPPRK